MRSAHAKPARAARKRTVATQQGARGLSPRAFSAKRRTQSGKAKAFPESVEPRREEAFDVAAAAGAFEAGGDGVALDDHERREGLNLEVLQQIRPLLLGYAH